MNLSLSVNTLNFSFIFSNVFTHTRGCIHAYVYAYKRQLTKSGLMSAITNTMQTFFKKLSSYYSHGPIFKK